MKEVLVWEQGGVKNVIFTKHILSIVGVEVENSNANGGCKISVDYNEDPIYASISVDEALNLLGINI